MNLDAPKRIWALTAYGVDRGGWSLHEVFPGEETRYVRADLADALLAELRTMTRHYVQLAESGDCGFWNPENEAEVKAARAAIAAYERSQRDNDLEATDDA